MEVTQKRFGLRSIMMGALAATFSVVFPFSVWAHGSKRATMNVTANVVCSVNGSNNFKTKCKKNTQVSMTTLVPGHAGIGMGVSLPKEAARAVREPLVWADTLQPSSAPSSIWDLERDFTPAPPPEETEINVDF
jgi:hypothetical protein